MGGHARLLRRSCGTCVNFDGELCTLYADMPVQEGDLCDEYQRGRGALLFGAFWLAVWAFVASLIYLVMLL